MVCMKLKDRSPEAAALIRDRLMTLPAKIPQIRHFEVGINIVESARAHDLALIARFDSLDDLSLYASHPDHLDVLTLIRPALETSVAVDYESG
ncbi:Dabb family protein [Kamptonema cortianum]|nr:Dabb family protein [Kamptonema cortianum]